MGSPESLGNASRDEGEDLSQERSRLAAWNETFLRLRRLTKGHQLLCLWVIVATLLHWDAGLQLVLSLSSSSEGQETGEGHRTVEALGKILASGALAEILMWMGHVWLIKPGRRLPTWPATVPGCCYFNRLMNRWGDWNLDWPFFNNALAVGLCCSIALCLIIDPLNRTLILTSLALYGVLSSIDRWRFLYSTYWIAGFVALLSPSTAVLSFHIVFGSLYFWAGFLKLTCKAFYSSTATIVFEPVYMILSKLHLGQAWVRNAVAGTAVGLEMLMGLLILVTPFIHPSQWTVECSVLKGGVLFINHGMHLYIITLIGYRNRVETFVSWNAMCAAIVALLYRGNSFQTVSADLLDEQSRFGALQVALFLFMWVPPLLQLFGRNSYPTLSHSWFVPGCGGLSTLIVSQEGYHNFPRSDNGVYIRGFRDPATIAKAIRLCGGKEALLKRLSLHPKGGEMDKDSTSSPQAQGLDVPTEVERELPKLVCLGGEWVDNTFRLYVDRHDDCNEHFGAGPKSFWQRIVTTVARVPCLLLIEDRNGVLGLPGLPDEACFLYPEE
jgi:hypothetical protein